MRSRSRIDAFPSASVNGGAVPLPRDESANTGILYHFPHAYFGPMLSGFSDSRSAHMTMIDDPTPLTGIGSKYKSVSHLKNSGIWISQPLTYGFTPPTPAFYGKLTGFICLTSVPPAITGVQWDSLVDSLAKQVTESVTSKFMGGVFLKELSETVSMVRNPFGLLTKTMVRKLPHGISAQTGSSLKRYSSLFLEYRYGWKPFYSDVCEFSKLLAHYYIRGDLQRGLVAWSKFRAGKLMDPPSGSLTTLYPNGSSKYQWDQITFSQTPRWRWKSVGKSAFARLIPNKAEYKASVTCQHLRPQVEVANVLNDVLNVLQVGTWRQVRDSLWEVLPLSFVADWFVNLGGIWRSQAEADLSKADVRNVGYSIKSSITFDLDILPIYPDFLEASDTVWKRVGSSDCITSGPDVISVKAASVTGHWNYYQRTPGLPPGGDTVLSRSGLDLLHGLDGLSLMIQKAPKPH